MYKTSDYLRNGVLYLNNIIRPHHKRLSTLMIYSTTKCQLLKTEDIHPPKTGISVHFSGSLV